MATVVQCVHERFFEHCLRVLWLAGAASSAARLARLLAFWHLSWWYRGGGVVLLQPYGVTYLKGVVSSQRYLSLCHMHGCDGVLKSGRYLLRRV